MTFNGQMRKWENPTYFINICSKCDFRFWVNAAGKELIGCLKKEIAKTFLTGLNPYLFRVEIYARSCETSQKATDESRTELSTYRDILEITDRVKKADVVVV